MKRPSDSTNGRERGGLNPGHVNRFGPHPTP